MNSPLEIFFIFPFTLINRMQLLNAPRNSRFETNCQTQNESARDGWQMPQIYRVPVTERWICYWLRGEYSKTSSNPWINCFLFVFVGAATRDLVGKSMAIGKMFRGIRLMTGLL